MTVVGRLLRRLAQEDLGDGTVEITVHPGGDTHGGRYIEEWLVRVRPPADWQERMAAGDAIYADELEIVSIVDANSGEPIDEAEGRFIDDRKLEQAFHDAADAGEI